MNVVEKPSELKPEDFNAAPFPECKKCGASEVDERVELCQKCFQRRKDLI